MIKRVNLPQGDFSGIAMLRINALFNTYGERAELYVQETNGEITAFFGGAQSGFSLCANDKADFSELDGFFEFLSAEVFCEGAVAEKLAPKSKRLCNVMRLTDDLKGCSNHSKISEVYDALKMGVDGDIELPPFDLWYTDFCLRFNHNAAEYSLQNGAVAVCGFMTSEASLITGVAVDGTLRGKGFGKKAVANLVAAIKEKYKDSEIYAASSEENKLFYEKIGFVFDFGCAVLRYGSV